MLSIIMLKIYVYNIWYNDGDISSPSFMQPDILRRQDLPSFDFKNLSSGKNKNIIILKSSLYRF